MGAEYGGTGGQLRRRGIAKVTLLDRGADWKLLVWQAVYASSRWSSHVAGQELSAAQSPSCAGCALASSPAQKHRAIEVYVRDNDMVMGDTYSRLGSNMNPNGTTPTLENHYCRKRIRTRRKCSGKFGGRSC